MRSIVRATTILYALVLSTSLFAAPLPDPSGPVLLSVSGNIQQTNSADGAHFDLAMLEALPQHQLDTTTPWTEGSHRYQGVLLSGLLDHLEARGRQMTAVALNDYRTMIDLDELRDYPVIIAIRKDGEYMRIRDKGPLWIVLPLSEFKELDRGKHHASMAWQLRKLIID